MNQRWKDLVKKTKENARREQTMKLPRGHPRDDFDGRPDVSRQAAGDPLLEQLKKVHGPSDQQPA